MGWTNGLEYLGGTGVKWTGIFSWSCSQMGWIIWMEMGLNGLKYGNELAWLIWMELE
jgi:hypothetical protein